MLKSEPIGELVHQMKLVPNSKYKMIQLSTGDPSVFGNFDPPTEATEAVMKAITDGKANGYGVPDHGTVEARQAVAKYSKQFLKYEPEIGNIALANGASGALEFAICAIAKRGDNILLPRPGYSLYQILAESQGIKCKFYDLDPDQVSSEGYKLEWVRNLNILGLVS